MMGVSYELADLYHRFIVAAFALGTVLALAGKKKNIVFLLLTIGFTNLMYLPYYTMPRYFYPVMPLIGIIAGFLFSELFRRKSKAVKK